MKKQVIAQKDGITVFAIGLAVLFAGSVVMSAFVTDFSTNLNLYIAFLLPQAGYLAVGFIYAKTKDISLNFNFKANANNHKYKYLLAIALSIGFFFAVLLPNFGLQKLYALLKLPSAVTVPALKSPHDFVLSFFIICLLPALGEELVFRKYLCDSFLGLGATKAVLISGALFAMSHFGAIQTVYQFAFGCLMAVLYIKTRDIVIPVICHLVNNILAFFLSSLTPESLWARTDILLICFFAGILIFGASLYMILRGTKKDFPKSEKLTAFSAGFMIILAVLWLIMVIIGD